MVSVSDRLPEVLLAGSPEIAPAAAVARPSARCWPSPPHHRSTLLRHAGRRCSRHDGSAKHAAEELYCHRNTVIYRTKQIEQLTGRTLTDPRDKLMLELALMTVEPESREHPG